MATIRQEALKENGKTAKKPSGAHNTPRRSKPRKRVGRVMREEHFEQCHGGVLRLWAHGSQVEQAEDILPNLQVQRLHSC